MKILGMNNSEKGASAVEFALVLPLLLTLLFGTVEFGLLMYDKAVLTNACREGARFGILSATTRNSEQDIKDMVKDYTDSNLITFGDAATEPVVTILWKKKGDDWTIPQASFTGQNFSDDLKVETTYQYNYLFMDNVINALIGGTNLRAQAIMKYE